jgi:hypothetical protein
MMSVVVVLESPEFEMVLEEAEGKERCFPEEFIVVCAMQAFDFALEFFFARGNKSESNSELLGGKFKGMLKLICESAEAVSEGTIIVELNALDEKWCGLVDVPQEIDGLSLAFVFIEF